MNMKSGKNDFENKGFDENDVKRYNEEGIGSDTNDMNQAYNDASKNFEEDIVREPTTGGVLFRKSDLKEMVNNWQAAMEVRKRTGNQIFAAFMKSKGIAPGTVIYTDGKFRQLMKRAFLSETDPKVIKDYSLTSWSDEELKKYDIKAAKSKKEDDEKERKTNSKAAEYVIMKLQKEYKLVTKLIVQISATNKKQAEEYAALKDLDEMRRILRKKFDSTVAKMFYTVLTKSENTEEQRFLTEYPIYKLVNKFMDELETEEHLQSECKKAMQYYRIWSDCFVHFPGIGEATIAKLVAKIDINKAEFVTALWKFAGYDTVMNPETGEIEGRSRKKHHLVPRVYNKLCQDKITKALEKDPEKGGDKTETKGISFNPDVKTALFLMNGALVYQGTKSPYYNIASGYKARIQNEVDMGKRDPKKFPKGRINMMTFRYVSKMFLQDLWVHWRLMSKLSIKAPYPDFYLKHESHIRTIDLETGELVLIDWHDVPNPKYLCGKLYQELPEDQKDDSQFEIKYGPIV